MTSVHLPFCFRYTDLFLCRVWHLCDLPYSVYALFRLISICKICFQVFKYWLSRDKVCNVPWRSQRKLHNWKLQASGHVMGLCRQSISGQNDLWSNWPLGFNSFASFHCAFFIFLCAIFRTKPLLSECLQEATRILGRVLPEKKICGVVWPTSQNPYSI